MAMGQEVTKNNQNASVTLGDFFKNKRRVFDAFAP